MAGKTMVQRDFGKRAISVENTLDGTAKSKLQQKVMNRLAGQLFENPAQMKNAALNVVCDLLYVQLRSEISGDEIFGGFNLVPSSRREMPLPPDKRVMKLKRLVQQPCEQLEEMFFDKT